MRGRNGQTLLLGRVAAPVGRPQDALRFYGSLGATLPPSIEVLGITGVFDGDAFWRHQGKWSKAPQWRRLGLVHSSVLLARMLPLDRDF